MNQHKSAIVIGAGLSGLTAALRLQDAGVEVTVLEAASKLSGRATSTHRDGFILDVGADAIVGAYRHYLRLVDDVGLTGSLVEVAAPVSAIRDGRIVTFTGSAPSMAATRLLSLPAKVRLAVGMARFKLDLRRRAVVGAKLTMEQDDPTSSSRELGEKYFGREATDYLIEPMVRLFNGTDAAGASAADVMGGLLATTTGNWSLRGGVGVLAEEIAERVPVRFDTRATEVAEVAGGVRVRVRLPDGSEETLRADGCVLAVMLEDAAAMHQPTAVATEELRASLQPPAPLPYTHLIKVQLAYDAPTHCPAFVVTSPVVEDDELMGMFLDHRKCSDRAPADHSLISVYMDSHVAIARSEDTDEQLTAWARAKVEALMPELRDHFLFAEVHHWPRLGLCTHPGFYRLAGTAFKKVPKASVVQGASDWFTKTSMETAVTRGDQAAAAMIETWSASGRSHLQTEGTVP